MKTLFVLATLTLPLAWTAKAAAAMGENVGTNSSPAPTPTTVPGQTNGIQSSPNGSASNQKPLSPKEDHRRRVQKQNHRFGTGDSQVPVQPSVGTVPTDSLGNPLPSNINNPTPRVNDTQSIPGQSVTPGNPTPSVTTPDASAAPRTSK